MSQNGNQNNDQNKQLSWTNNQQNKQNGNQQKPAQQPQQAPVSATPAPAASAPAKPAVASAPAKPASDSSRGTARVVGWLAVGVIAGVIIAWGATSLTRQSGSGATTAGSLENASSTEALATSTLLTVASPQKAGTTVAVSGINVSEPTWVAVNESRDGQPGNVLGAGLFFPGTTSGTVTLLRGTVAGQTYFVTERKDNGDHRFSLTADSLVTVDGQPSSATFTAN